MANNIINSDVEKTFDNLIKDDYNPFDLLGKEVIKSVKTYGFGVLPKSDLEGLIFHCICNTLEAEFNNNIQELDYVLMQMLKISPSKLRSLRVIRSAKFLANLDYNDPNNKLRLVRSLRNVSIVGSEITNPDIKISISDPHSQQLIERILEDNGGIADRSLNPKLLILKPQGFLDLVEKIYGQWSPSTEEYVKLIDEIKSEAKELHNELTKENLLKEFHSAFKERAVVEMVNVLLRILERAAKRKMGLI